MKNSKTFIRTLFAAAIIGTASSANAISLNSSVDAATQLVTDTSLTGTVKGRIATDKRLEGADISVKTESGVVILTGTAPTAEAKSAAAELAASADGNVRVDNRIEVPGVMSDLKVEAREAKANIKAEAREMKDDTKQALSSTGEKITDGWISTKVKTQLLADTLTTGTAIKVTTKNNVVYLKGKVASAAEKAEAIRLASTTEGVVKVNASRLKVSAKARSSAN